MPDFALARAKYLDDYLAKNKRPLGPLHGLPISLKDQCRIKVRGPPRREIPPRKVVLWYWISANSPPQGFDTTMGYAGWIDKIDEGNSVIVDLLEKAGAVFYVKTSVPQSLMVCEAINNVFGRTSNPRNRNWSSGGSTGGEGALIGFRGSVMGIGTDIGRRLLLPAV